MSSIFYYRPSSLDLASSTLAQIAVYAASKGQNLNIGDVRAWLKEKHGEGDAEYAKTILCMPIINGQRTIIGKDNVASFLFFICLYPPCLETTQLLPANLSQSVYV